MTAGKFFLPDLEYQDDCFTSIFRYVYIVREDRLSDAEKFPIYVTLNDRGIIFTFQGIAETMHLFNSNENNLYVQSPLMYIPLGTYFFEETHKDVIEIFNRGLSLQFTGDYKFLNYSDKEHEISYSALPVFSLSGHSWENATWQEHCYYTSRVLRRLLLDFLDDFFNSPVFRLSSNYKKISDSILNSYLLKGIYLKADFYSKQKIYLAGEEDRIQRNQKPDTLSAVRHLTALENWIDFMLNQAHKYLFSGNNAWFDYTDREIKLAISANKAFTLHKNLADPDLTVQQKNGGQKTERGTRHKNILKKGVNLLVENYEIFKAVYLFFYRAPRWIPSMFLAILPIVFSYCYFESTAAHEGWKWLVFAIALFSWAGVLFLPASVENSAAGNLILPRMLMAVSTAWIAILTNVDYLKRWFSLDAITALGYSGTLIIIMALFLVYEIKRNTFITSAGKVGMKVFNVIFFGLILSMSVGLTGMALVSKDHMTKSDFLDTKNAVRENIAEIKKRDMAEEDDVEMLENIKIKMQVARDDSQKAYRRSLEIAYKRLRAQIKDNKDFRKNLVQNLSGYHLNDPRKKLDDVINDPKASKVVYYYDLFWPDDHTIAFFPGFFIMMSSFALFSGIFLTLLFDNKPVTDPL